MTFKGEVKANWNDLVKSLDYKEEENSGYQSLIKGQVLSANSSREFIFRIESEAENQDSSLAGKLSQAIINEELDVSLCYCSVYDECWTARYTLWKVAQWRPKRIEDHLPKMAQ